MGKRDDAKLLGVEPGATADELRQAFRGMARECHPDVAGEGSAARFVSVREAYERLRDRHWETKRKAARKQPEAREKRGVSTRGRSVDFINLVDGLLKNGGRAGGARKILEQIEVVVPLDYLIFGAQVSIYFPVEVTCPHCQGRGLRSDTHGAVTQCRECDGDGNREKRLKVPLSFPPGLRSGEELRVPLDEAGMPGYDLMVEIVLVES